MVRQQTIDPKCSVARILSLEMNGTLVQGTFTPTNTPLGLAYNQEILEGVIPGFLFDIIHYLLIHDRHQFTGLIKFLVEVFTNSLIDYGYRDTVFFKEQPKIVNINAPFINTAYEIFYNPGD